MKKYFNMSIEQNDYLAMNYLGEYYKDIENFEEMKKYYLMAIKFNDEDAILKMAYYYIDNNDNENEKIYLKMSVKNGSIESSYILGHIYYNENLHFLLLLFQHVVNLYYYLHRLTNYNYHLFQKYLENLF